MDRVPLSRVFLLLMLMPVLAVVPVGCTESNQRQVQTEVAKAAQTKISEGGNYAATQIASVKETAVAAAITQAVSVKETAVAGAPTQAIILKETGVAAAGTQAVILRETAVAAAATQGPQFKQTAEALIAAQLTPRPAVKPEVQSARDKLKALAAMRSHWTQVTAPIQNLPGQRSASKYADVIDQFDVESAELVGRYQSGGAGNVDTRCNIFAGDVMRAMGVPLPTKGNLGAGQGDPAARFTDPMTAQAPLLNAYLNLKLFWVTGPNDRGTRSDWLEIKPATAAELRRLIDHVNAGKPALASDLGHIAVIRPNQPAVNTWQDLVIAQAGALNFQSGPIRNDPNWTPQFFIHE